MTSSFSPVRSGSRCIRSGLPPAIAAAVQLVTPAQQPALTMPHSAPVNSLSRRPTASINSSMWTKLGAPRSRGRSRGAYAAAERRGRGHHPAATEQVAAAEAGPGLFDVLPEVIHVRLHVG